MDKEIELVLLSQEEGRGEENENEFILEKVSEAFSFMGTQAQVMNGGSKPRLGVGGLNSLLRLWSK